MKIIMTVAATFSLALTAFAPVSIHEKEKEFASQQFATVVVDALKKESAETYLALFPAVTEFQKMMENNRSEYGPFLKEAQDEFAIQYTQSLVPAVQESFTALIREGKKRNIDWENVQIDRVEGSYDSQLSIRITSGNEKFKIEFEKVLYISGQLRVTQFVKLI